MAGPEGVSVYLYYLTHIPASHLGGAASLLVALVVAAVLLINLVTWSRWRVSVV